MFVSARVPSEEVYPVWTGASNDARNRPHAPETTLAYNCPMDRLVDKTAILLACVLLVVSTCGPSPVGVVALLAAIIASASYELLRARHGLASDAALTVVTALLSVSPASLCALPLVAYDLARSRWRWTPLLCLAGPVAWASARGIDALSAVATIAACALAALLSFRTSHALTLELRLHSLEDDLSDKVIALREKNRELEDASDYETRAATLAERTRIAREIHDNVGHLLTRLVLQVEALKVMHEGEARTIADFDDVERGLDEALGSMRSSVHALADAAVDLPTKLNQLARDSGIPSAEVHCNLESEVPAGVSRCVIAVVREALTNAARHAQATHASVRLTECPGIWQVLVRNDGAMPTLSPMASDDALLRQLSERGMGISSLEDRVEGLGGTMRVSCDGTSFTLFASIPREGR